MANQMRRLDHLVEQLERGSDGLALAEAARRRDDYRKKLATPRPLRCVRRRSARVGPQLDMLRQASDRFFQAIRRARARRAKSP